MAHGILGPYCMRYILTVKNAIPDFSRVMYMSLACILPRPINIVKALKFAEKIVKGPYFVFQIELVARALALLPFALALALALTLVFALILAFALARSLS